MNSKKDTKLSAHFPGLIDVCEADDGQLLYLIADEGNYTLQESTIINGCEKERDHAETYSHSSTH
jgi:hypothetical protein